MIDDLFLGKGSIGALATTEVQVLALPASARHILLANAGAYPVTYKLGFSSGVTVSLTDGDWILPESKELFSADGATHIAVLTEIGSSRFSATVGFGET